VKKLLLFSVLTLACSAETISFTEPPRDGGISVPQDSQAPDYHVIDSSVRPPIIDASPPVLPCQNLDVSDHEKYCLCLPQCCETQEWYCPPTPDQTIQSMQVVLEVCDEEEVSCVFGEDEDCPPPQIIHRSPCQVTHECPPGSTRDFLRWFECQLEDGTFGRQRVLCDKGVVVHGPCTSCDPEVCDGIDNDCDDRIDEDPILCEDECGPGVGLCQNGVLVECVNRDPEEEICNFIDDDCDGEIDEDQRNDCDGCGELPLEVCDSVDNDCDGRTDESLLRECETQCNRGLETCINGRWGSCTARQPVQEICDGLDNDCDGIPDEGINCLCTIDQVGVLIPCAEPPLFCGMGFKTCQCRDVDCQIIELTPCLALCVYLPEREGEECHPGIGRPVEPEICNNFDEDCDNLVDEQLTQACYTGPPGTINVGICLPGEQSCVEGQWGGPNGDGRWTENICSGEIIPAEEVCDGADNDCDGENDYGEDLHPTDILLIIDTSGSMSGEIRAVTAALSRFGQHFAAEDAIHWGLIIGPTRAPNPDFPGSDHEVLTRVSDIAPFQQFFDAFVNLDPLTFDGGFEMLMDAVMLSLRNLSPLHVDLAARNWIRGVVSVPEKDNFIINWRRNTDRIIIVFTDENEQSYFNPPFHRNDLTNALAAAPNTKLYTFALAFYFWDEFAIATGGRNFDLTSRADQMYDNLMSIIDEICLPQPGEQAGFRRIPQSVVKYQFASELMCF